ncbi:sensor histidine kinase [Peribacillus frigoritolerans]|uniref:cache domain-containing sensor histidine kinase n=1 Tax=Peribacillus frigoritolerans TaxID=450367 RepID=UPI002E9B58EE|nr:histidine kinase [Peribacillus frigoritolerans]
MRPTAYQLRSKLIITYILLTVIPLSILAYFSYHQYTKMIEEQVGEYIPKTLDQANRNIDKEISELESLPELLYYSNQVLSILRKESYSYQSHLNNDRFLVNNYLSQTYFTEKSPLLGVFVWSKNGLFSSTKFSYSGLHKEQNINGKKSIIYQDQTGLRFQGKPHFFLINQQIKDLDNRRNIGMISMAVQLSLIENILMEIKDQREAEMWVMDHQGKVVYHTDHKLIGTIEDMGEYPISNGSFSTNKNGIRQLVSVSESEKMNWIIVHRITVNQLTEKAELIKRVTILTFVVIGAVTVIISMFMAWGVSRPIRNLSILMKDVEEGNFEVDLKVKSNDEMGILAQSFNSMVIKIRELIQQNNHIEIRQKQAELYALQSQINPHFMYNTLETISAAVEDEEDDIVVEMVALLGSMLRFSLSNKNRIVQFDKEVEHIENYLTIQTYRFEERLNFNIKLDINLKQHYSPKFILQPIIENCIKHGLEARIGGLAIDIHITTVPGIFPETEDIMVNIQDDGDGINRETLGKIHRLLQSDPMAKRDSGFGLINVHARIVMLFGEGYGLNIESKNKEGTVIKIRLPIIDRPELVSQYDRKEDDFHE